MAPLMMMSVFAKEISRVNIGNISLVSFGAFMSRVFRITKAEWADNQAGEVLLAFRGQEIAGRADAFVLSKTTGRISFGEEISLVVDIPSTLTDVINAAEKILIVLFDQFSIRDEFWVPIVRAP